MIKSIVTRLVARWAPPPRTLAIGPRPGPHWRPFEITVHETRRYGVTIHAWSAEQAERKADLMWATDSPGDSKFDWREIETMDVKVREAR